MAEDIDELIRQIEVTRQSRDEAVENCERELDAGRTGLTHYQTAKLHQETLEALVTRAQLAIDLALKELSE